MRLLPYQFVLNKNEEADFQHGLNERSRLNAELISYLVIAVLLVFIVSSNYLTDNSFIDNLFRGGFILLTLPMIFTSRSAPAKYLDKIWCCFASVLMLLIGFFFYNYAITHNELNEGGPILAVISIASIPMLHLAQKLLIWMILFIALVSIQLTTMVDITWSLNFYLFTVVMMSAMQYQLDIIHRKQYQYELVQTQKARTDKLTGINNRYSFDKEFASVLSSLTTGQYLSLAMIDIDYFKKYNDIYGHLAGDRTLIAFAELLSDLSAKLVVRFGGEEFILVSVFNEDNPHWLEDLPQKLKQLNIEHSGSDVGYVTASVGIATVSAAQRHTVGKTMLLTEADRLLYKAKHAGRNQVLNQKI
ncbi:GGDEF domain-containing protein [Shewanella youngdeokensis]|uniref:diguanylate cyclase n=1 Tax=Shewanella youngdeokensis TaxID=2999068 RepID=A0ABZ0JYZ5_9GAMM|nr:GGDEF domain-containing protein [Shewanella sp. DAU334]